MRSHRADLQPAVGCRQEEVGRVVGVRQLQHPLLEPSFMSERIEHTSHTHQPFFRKSESKQPKICSRYKKTPSFNFVTYVQLTTVGLKMRTCVCVCVTAGEFVCKEEEVPREEGKKCECCLMSGCGDDGEETSPGRIRCCV